MVNVTDGPFEGFAGTVEEVDDINSRLKLTVSIFGRANSSRIRIYSGSKTKTDIKCTKEENRIWQKK